MIGGDGNDTLNGGKGNDVLAGGQGDDIYVADSLTDSIVEGEDAGQDTVQTALTWTLGANLENLTLTGSAAINGTGNGLDNVLTGNSAINSLSGGGGNDTLDGKGGVDILKGGNGNDTYIVDLTSAGALQDTLTENASEGTDTVVLRGASSNTSAVTLTLGANLENLDASATGLSKLNLTGTSASNVLTGNEAANILDGGSGADTLIGGLGNDTYVIDNAGDVISEAESQGNDLVKVAIATANGSYTLGANLEKATLTNTVAFNLTGNDANNQLKGNLANNIIDGGAGADSMDGGEGNDTYIVDNVGDTITDSLGTDTVKTQLAYTLGATLEKLILTGSDAVAGTGNALANVLDGYQNSAANLLSGLTGNDTYILGEGDSVIEAANAGTDLVKSYVDFQLGNNLENLTLLGSADINATGNTLANALTGNQGANTLDGKAGVDILKGGNGNDTYIVDLTSAGALQDTLTENASEGTDSVVLRGASSNTSAVTLTLGANLENLDASATGLSKLNLTGTSASNVLTGNEAANILDGGSGADTLIGGLGNDTYVIDNAGDVISEAESQGNDLVKVAIATANGSYTLGANLEKATLTNTVAFNLTGNDANNQFKGNLANNIIDGGAGADSMDGGEGNDTYIVDNVGDTITDSLGTDTVKTQLAYTLGATLEKLILTGSDAVAGTGNALANVLDGYQNSAANLLSGLTGNDTYILGEGDSVIEAANAGTDLVKSYVDFQLGNNLENLTLLGSADINATGNTLANALTGNQGANTLDGKAGVDILKGGNGNDTYIVDLTSAGALQDTLTENASEGTDSVVLRGASSNTSAVTLTLGANLENLDASATGLSKLNLTGTSASNVLTGNDFANVLSGLNGNDTLDGGAGNDTLIGGAGADHLSGGLGNDIFRFAALGDLGLNGSQDAILDFTNGDKLDFKALGGYSFKGEASFDGTKQLRIEQSGEDLIVYGNSGGDLNADFSIKLLGVATLTGSDFIFS
ncbi:calcium-binding protein [Aquipseudomonas campi]|uniref:Calcium-binding protein n=1 Tax=Aquipseudomonas campi TaxID=2731681 RepID=A0A6M8FP71_9GAMM|nr:calcium-binding protein [Pseudomonas campi]